MALARIKKGDNVVILAGRERGKRGVVRQVRRDIARAKTLQRQQELAARAAS